MSILDDLTPRQRDIYNNISGGRYDADKAWNESYLQEQEDQQKATAPIDSGAEDKPWYDDIAAVGHQAFAGGSLNTESMYGKAMQALHNQLGSISAGLMASDEATDRDSFNFDTEKKAASDVINQRGAYMEKTAKQSLNSDSFKDDRNRSGAIVNFALKGADQVIPSATAMIPVVGQSVGVTAFGASQYKDTFDRIKADGGSDDDAHRAGLISGAIESAGEFIAGKVGAKLVGSAKPIFGFGTKTAASVLAQSTDKAVLVPFLKQFGETMVAESATEAAQNVGEEITAREYGAKAEKNADGTDQTYGDIAKDAAVSAASMTTFLAPFGVHASYRASKRNSELDQLLKDPSAPKEQRLLAAGEIFGEAKNAGAHDADEWIRGAIDDVNSGLPIRRNTNSSDRIDSIINGESTNNTAPQDLPNIDHLDSLVGGLDGQLQEQPIDPIKPTGDTSNPDDKYKFELDTDSFVQNLRSRIDGINQRKAAEAQAASRDLEQQQSATNELLNRNMDALPSIDETLSGGANGASDGLFQNLTTKNSNLARDAEIDTARRSRMPENMPDTRLLRSRFRDHLGNVLTGLDTHGDSLSNADSLMMLAAKNGGLNAEAWKQEGVDPADIKAVNGKSYAKAFRNDGGMTPDDLAEFAHQRGFTGMTDSGGNLNANAALNAVNDEISGNKTHYSAEDEALLQSSASSPAFISSLKGLGSAGEIKQAINLALSGKKLGSNQAKIVQEALDGANTHNRDNEGIQKKWAERSKTRLANLGNKHLDNWRNRDEHLPQATTHEAALNEIMSDAIVQHGIDPAKVSKAYTEYAQKYPTQGQLTAAMMSWVSANKPDTKEHLSHDRQTQLLRGSSGQRGAIESGARVSPESEGSQAGAAPNRTETATYSEPDSGSDGRDTGLRQPVASALNSGEGVDQSIPERPSEAWEGSILRARKKAMSLGIKDQSKMKLPELVEAIKAHEVVSSKMETTTAKANAAIEGKSIDGDWTEFSGDSGSLNIPRAEMPQIKAEHRGAMVNFLNARDVAHQEETVPADSLKPTQLEFSKEKVKKALGFEGGSRSILVSSDNHVLDGHHQWLASREKGEDVKVIRLDAPIKKLVKLAHEFPSSTVDTKSGQDSSQGNQEAIKSATLENTGDAQDAPTTNQEAVKQADNKKPKDYGTKNKLVSSSRAEELRAKLKAKLNNLNSGIDPETLAIGTELAVYHIEAGTRSFVDFAHTMAQDLGSTIDKIKPYLRSWYNGARDMMEDSGLSIDGMSSPDEVRESLNKLSDAPAGTQENDSVTKGYLGKGFSQYLLDRLDTIKDNRSLKDAIKTYSGLQNVSEVTNEMLKKGQESLELALVKNARGIVELGGTNKQIYNELVESYSNQPLLDVRSSTSMENQAYSTPAPLAFLAGKLAGIDGNTKVYEPTAGNGMLLMLADAKNAYANELDSSRAEQLKTLGFNVTEKDGSDYLPSVKVDSAIMNPPFGNLDKFGKPSTVSIEGFNIKKIDHLITIKALEAIKDDGRATIIVGANKEAGIIGNGAERVFLNYLYSHYNVIDHFEVDGDLYRRQGAGWPVRVITVNGRMESKNFAPKSGSVERLDNWNDIYEHANAILDSEGFRTVRIGKDSVESSAQASGQAGSDALNDGQASAIDGRSGTRGSGSDTQSTKLGLSEQQHDQLDDKPTRNSGNTGYGGHATEHDAEQSQSNAGKVGADKSELGGRSGKSDVRNDNDAVVSNRKPVLGGGASEFQADYKALSTGFNESVLTPKNMADATQSALSDIERAVGSIDEYVVEKLGYKSVDELHDGMMGLQVDTVAAAIYNIENRKKGIIIADQTGVGKGRQAAGLIRYAMLTGKTPIFVTVKPNLYSDMYGDLMDIGTKNAKPFVTNANTAIEHNDQKLFSQKPKDSKNGLEHIADNGELPDGFNMLFTTYDQLKGDSKNSRRDAIKAIRNPLFILDESHNAAGEMYTEKKVNGGKVKVTTTAGFVYEVIGDKPVVYLSATYAKRPDNMPIYYRTDLLDAVDTPQELIDAINAGGVPLQQVVASMLASNGQLFRRERSFAGIKMNFAKDTSNVAEQERISDDVNTGLREIVDASSIFAEWYEANHQSIEPPGGSVKLAGNKADAMAGSVNPFTSVVHNYIRQLLLGIKAKNAATKAIELHKSGKKPVIALENTLGSFLAEYAVKHKLKVGDEVNFTYTDILKTALERTRRVSFKDEKGDSVPLPIELHQLDPFTRGVYERAEESINNIDLSALPASPIDYMMNEMRKAGMRVDEITGRGYFIDYSGKKPVLGYRSEKEIKERRSVVDKFNNGRMDGLVLNSAGSTGLSIHASERFKDQSPRHMIIAQPMQDINTLMQMLGRINRTGQVELPEFTFLSLDLPSEIRPTATTKAKMAKLNANTSANDKSDTSFESPDFMNKYGDQVVNEYLQDNRKIEVATGIYSSTDSNLAADDLALRFTGRLALLDVKVQREVMSDILQAYNEKIEYLNKTGQNDLVAQDLPLDAYILDSKIVHEGKDPESMFAGHTTLHKVNVKYLGKSPTADDVIAAMDESLDGKTPEEFSNAIIKGKDSDTRHLASMENRYKEAEQEFKKKQNELDGAKKSGADDKKITRLQNSYTSAENRVRELSEDISAYHAARNDIMNTLEGTLKVGKRIRIDTGDEVLSAVVVGLKNTHKNGVGNPWLGSKVRVTLMVNSGVRQISVNYKQLMGKGGLFVESMRGSGKDGLGEIFKKDNLVDRREQRFIATGNLIAGTAKLNGGKIVNFTDSAGSVHQGILMPRRYGKQGEFDKGDSVSNVIVRDAKVLAKYLALGGNAADIGAFSAGKVVRVSAARDGGLTINVPIANKNKIAFNVKLDKALRDIVGDFYGKSQTQSAAIPKGKEREALARLMEITPLSIPANMRDALVSVGGEEAPEALHSFDGKTTQSGAAPTLTESNDEPASKSTPAESKTNDDGRQFIETWEDKDTRDGSPIYMAKAAKQLERTDFNKLASIAKEHDGFYSRFAKGFLFKDAGKRGAFVAESTVKVGGSGVRYSLNDDTKDQAETHKNVGITQESAQAVIDGIKSNWKHGLFIVKAVSTIDDLPSDLRNRIKADGKGNENVRALVYGSSIYINASQMKSAQDVERAVFHEAYGHLGLRVLFGENFRAALGRLYLAVGGEKGLLALAKKNNIDLSRYQELSDTRKMSSAEKAEHLVDELLAHIQQDNKPSVVRYLKEMIGAVRAWLRAHGFTMLGNMNDSELISVLKAAREAAQTLHADTANSAVRYLLGDKSSQNGNDSVRYSLSEKARKMIKGNGLLELWGALAQHDSSFSYDTSDSKNIEEVFETVGKKFNLTLNRSEYANRLGRKQWSIIRDGEDTGMMVIEKGDNVYVNVALGAPGEGGSAIYSAVGSYAYNTGKVFIGDPNGLSDEAVSRRLENMISLALKFGTTSFMRPHDRQVKGAAGVDGVSWIDGNDSHNLRSMIMASYKNVLKQLPEFGNWRYNFDKDAYIDEDGNDVTHAEAKHIFTLIRSSAVARGTAEGVARRKGIPFTAGSRSYQRALLTHTFLRGTSSEKSELLDRVRGDGAKPSALSEILYSLNETNETRSQGGFSASMVGKLIPGIRGQILRREQAASLPPNLRESFLRSGQNKTLTEKILSEVKRQLTPAGLLPKDVFDLKVVRDGEMNANEMRTRHTLRGFYDAIEKAYGKEYAKLTAATKREINKAMRGDEGVQLAPSVVGAIGVMRDDIKRLSSVHIRQLAADAAELKEQGKDAEAESKLRTIETVSANFDTYLHRSYRAFDDKAWPEKVPANVYEDAVNFLASEYADGGTVTQENIKLAEKRVHMILHEGTAFESMGAFISESKLGAKDLSIMKKRKDVPAPIRALLGEYEDAALNYTKSVTKMSSLVHNHAFLTSMKATAIELGLLHDKENLELDATKKIAGDNTEAYAPLNGLYTTKEFEQALKDALGKTNPNAVYDAIVAANGMVKFGKTVLSPTTAARNFMSSLFFTLSNGHFDWSQMSKSWEAKQVYFTDRGDESVKEYLMKLRKIGVIYDSPYASEMMDLLKDSRLSETLQRGGTPLLDGAKKAIDFAQRFYSMGDDFYKIVGFENEKAMLMKHRGMSENEAEKEAAERIRNTCPTYSMIGRGVNVLRRFPVVGSFVSFPAEIIRTSYHITNYLAQDYKKYGLSDPIVRRKLIGYALAAGAIGGLSALSAAMFGVGDDEEESLRIMAPEWTKNSTIFWLPRDEDGKRQYIDLTFLDPYGYWKKPIMAAMRGKSVAAASSDAAQELLTPFFGLDIAFKAIGEATLNKKVGGGAIYNESESTSAIAGSIADHLRKALQPGLATNVERFILASKGEYSKSGKQYRLSEEAAALVGLRIGTFDPKSALYYQAMGYQDEKAQAAKILKDVATDINEVSQEELQAAFKQSLVARKKAFDDMQTVVDAGRSAGLTKQQLISALRNSGVSVKDAMALANNRQPVFAPSNTMMKSAIKKASVLFDEETRLEFKRREKSLNDLRKQAVSNQSALSLDE